MLPGLRFLFAATLMSVSLLVFGMGAIALLRASHPQFAGLPPLQPPEPVFAQAPATMPSLSMLRADPAPTALPLATLIQPQREASLTFAERPPEAASPSVPSATTEVTKSEPAPDAGSVTLATPAESTQAPKAEASPTPQIDQNSTAPAEPPAASPVAAAETPAQTEKVADLPVQDSPPQTEPTVPSTQIAAIASEPASPETTGSVASPDTPTVAAKAIADPPRSQTRPEVAALSQVAAKAAVTTTEAPKKPAAKRKVRHVKHYAPRVEKLPATTSAPPLSLSSFFNGGGG